MLRKSNLAPRVRKSKRIETDGIKMFNPSRFEIRGTEHWYTVRFDGNRASCGCYGNYRSVCYHVFAALLERAKNADVQIAFCANREDARRLSNLGGTFHRVTNGRGSDEVFFVAFRDAKTEDVDALQQAILRNQLDDILHAIEVAEDRLERNPWSMRAQKSVTYLGQSRRTIEAQIR